MADSFEIEIVIESCADLRDAGEAYRISVEVEVDFDGHFEGDGVAVFLAGFEAPGFDGFDSFFVEAHAERVDHADVGGAAVGRDDDHQRAGALIFGLAGFF